MRELFFLACFAAVFAGVFLMTRAPFPNAEVRPAFGKQFGTVLNRITITYYGQGTGPRVVLLASAGREVSDFNELAADLVYAGYRTVAAGMGPMLVVQAADDKIAPIDDTADVLKSQNPDRVSVVTIENAGHALLHEQPAAISKAVLDFLATHHRN